MRTKRTIIAPALLTLGAFGAILAGPVMAFTTAVAPGTVAVASASTAPGNMYGYHT